MAELVNEFAWSFSRHHALSDCPRRYWFRHYAFWGGWKESAPLDVREIYRLTKLEDRASWRGKVVHEAIARALWRARRGRPVESVDDYVADVLARMREDYRDSKSDRARKSGRYKDHVRFFEHEERLDDGSETWRARWKESADDAERCLRQFFASRTHALLKELPEERWLELEDPLLPVGPSFELDGVKVWVKLDAAYREGEGAVVIDWKTGRSSSPLTPVQLAAYALYLQRVHRIPPEALEAREINVLTGKVVPHDVGPDALETFREVFAESVARMRSYLSDVRRNVPKPASAFEYTQDERTCRSCHFRSICPKTAPAY